MSSENGEYFDAGDNNGVDGAFGQLFQSLSPRWNHHAAFVSVLSANDRMHYGSMIAFTGWKRSVSHYLYHADRKRKVKDLEELVYAR